MPGALLNGSFLLGSISRLVLGTAADATTVNVHPFLIAGWCGIVSSALNCLPVGCLDGGRVMMVGDWTAILNNPSSTLTQCVLYDEKGRCKMEAHHGLISGKY